MLSLKTYNQNPKGKKTGDCVIRAISYATGKSWDEVLDGLVAIAHKLKAMPSDKKTYEKYLEDLGWAKFDQPRKWDGKKYLVAELDSVVSESFLKEGHIIVSLANHLTTIEGDKVVDTWDCRFKTIGNYWIKKEVIADPRKWER